MMPYGDDLDYAKKRLERTVITHESGDLAYVLSVEEDFAVHYGVITDSKVNIQFPAPLRDFDLTPINLGFSNSPVRFTSAYICRKPMRRDWKQGISETSCLFINVAGADKTSVVPGGNFSSILSRFYQPHFNIYPTFAECLDKICKGAISAAFHRHFCLGTGNNSIILFYKTTPVGVVKDGEVTLDSKYFYLLELLEEAVNG